MKRIVMKRDLPLGGGKFWRKGASVKVSDAEAARLIGARFAVEYAEPGKSAPKRKPAPPADKS